jgi:hypothetical protein
MRFYRVSGRRLWGDYGEILIGGMSRHLPRRDDLIQLERTGPFIPPMTMPGIGDIVITSSLKDELEASNLAQLTFAPVLKARIVEYHWDQWDRTSQQPAEYPETGEPERLFPDGDWLRVFEVPVPVSKQPLRNLRHPRFDSAPNRTAPSAPRPPTRGPSPSTPPGR